MVFSAKMKRLELMKRLKIMNEDKSRARKNDLKLKKFVEDYKVEIRKMQNVEQFNRNQYFRGKAMFGANCRFSSHPRNRAGNCTACFAY